MICGKANGVCKLTRYSLQMGVELGTLTLEEDPSGMTDIQYKGTMCLALAYWYVKGLFKQHNETQHVV